MMWIKFKYDRTEWYPWFAWYPVQQYVRTDGNKDYYTWYWLVWLECKENVYAYDINVEYRLPVSK